MRPINFAPLVSSSTAFINAAASAGASRDVMNALRGENGATGRWRNGNREMIGHSSLANTEPNRRSCRN